MMCGGDSGPRGIRLTSRGLGDRSATQSTMSKPQGKLWTPRLWDLPLSDTLCVLSPTGARKSECFA